LLFTQNYAHAATQAYGYNDAFALSGGKYVVGGWACILGQSTPIDVAIYAGNPASGGTLIGTYLANQPSSTAIASGCKSTGSAYRFSVPLPASALLPYAGKSIYVVGLTPGNVDNYTLVGSGTFSIPSIMNGFCGASNGATVTSAPTTGLCGAGTTSVVTGTGPFNWSCAGTNGGSTQTCSTKLPPLQAYGYNDSFALSGGQYFVGGWACILGQSTPIDVAIYAGNPATGGTLIGTYLANHYSSTVVAAGCN
jgi:hypothetical protein